VRAEHRPAGDGGGGREGGGRGGEGGRRGVGGGRRHGAAAPPAAPRRPRLTAPSHGRGAAMQISSPSRSQQAVEATGGGGALRGDSRLPRRRGRCGGTSGSSAGGAGRDGLGCLALPCLALPCLALPCLAGGEYLPAGVGRTRRGTGRAGLLHRGHVAVGGGEAVSREPCRVPGLRSASAGAPGRRPLPELLRDGGRLWTGPGSVLRRWLPGGPGAWPVLCSQPRRQGGRSRGALGALCALAWRKSK